MSSAPWRILRSDYDNTSIITIPEGTTAAEALARLLSEGFGGEWSPTDPAVITEAERVTIARWWSCRKAWKDGHCVDPDEDWWAPDGDGTRSVWVATHPEDAYDLGVRMEPRPPVPDTAHDTNGETSG